VSFVRTRSVSQSSEFSRDLHLVVLHIEQVRNYLPFLLLLVVLLLVLPLLLLVLLLLLAVLLVVVVLLVLLVVLLVLSLHLHPFHHLY
jgi:ABC-type transport system involved in cytochrome bd biosynthesis fused ATPase/permease subunit